jgi:hypothetical protein
MGVQRANTKPTGQKGGKEMEKSPINKEPEVFCRALRVIFDKGTEYFILSGPARKEVTLLKAEFSKEYNGWLAIEVLRKIPRGPSDPINWPTRSAIQLLKSGRKVRSYEWVNNP